MNLSEEQLNQNYEELERLTGAIAGSPSWVSLLTLLRDDQTLGGVTYLGLRNAPAAKGNHHAYHGGLVAHLLEMWGFYTHLQPALPPDPLICNMSVLRGIILHDLHKAWATFVTDPAESSGVNYGKHLSSSLMTNDQKSIYICSTAGIRLSVIETNCLWSSEGGWAENPPKFGTTLGKLVYLLDELSGNVAARSQQGNTVDLRKPNVDLSSLDLFVPQS